MTCIIAIAVAVICGKLMKYTCTHCCDSYPVPSFLTCSRSCLCRCKCGSILREERKQSKARLLCILSAELL